MDLKRYMELNTNGLSKNSIFNSVKIEYGVLQGSILRAFVFIIYLYINDLRNIVRKCKLVSYANDTLVYAEGKSI